jgi:hypothetical protein
MVDDQRRHLDDAVDQRGNRHLLPGRAGADQNTVWTTDSSGNYLSGIIGVVPGNSSALENLETTFRQDLNGDGTIGPPPPPPPTLIESNGATDLSLLAQPQH